ncbi:hypothetical protein P8C59_008595 [Phyllachora maydis]|uniref:Uncharacterized protein n=1 Tax=Phyllachora maydis TaxID=1825666 RepID=A0AAD9MFC7_9PEZI|nr:hypothetical protein P8C59_008595 [Phyllachora maydis]
MLVRSVSYNTADTTTIIATTAATIIVTATTTASADHHLNGNIEIEDRQTTTIASTTAKKTAIGAITTVPTAPSSSTPPTINAPTISAPPSTNVFAPFLRGLNGIAVKGLTVYNQVIEEGLLEKAKKQYPIARQPRRPIRRGSSKAARP